jgi:hypothetical protein
VPELATAGPSAAAWASVIAGRGKKLFANVAATHRVRHLSTKTFPSGVVLVKHARA